MSVFNFKNKNGERFFYAFSHSGDEGIIKGCLKITMRNDGRLEIKIRFRKSEPYYLKYTQITNVGVVTEKEIEEANKSVIGRAAIGGLLLGPLGAVVGGVSGVGKKQKTKSNIFIVINYISSDSSEPKVITFLYPTETNFPFSADKFVKELREKSGLQPVEKKKINHNL